MYFSVVLGGFMYFYRCDGLSLTHVSSSLQMCSLLTVWYSCYCFISQIHFWSKEIEELYLEYCLYILCCEMLFQFTDMFEIIDSDANRNVNSHYVNSQAGQLHTTEVQTSFIW